MKKILNNKGQTAVEYILLIIVMISVGTSVFKKLEEYLVTNPNSFVNKYLDTYRQSFGMRDGGVRANYRIFRVKR